MLCDRDHCSCCANRVMLNLEESMHRRLRLGGGGRRGVRACGREGRMKAHIVGGGFAGLAAAALLIRNANVSGPDITIYEAEDKLGGGFFLDGDAEHGYNLPGSIFDKQFRCALDLLATIPTLGYSNINVAEQFLTFNNEHPFVDRDAYRRPRPPPRAWAAVRADPWRRPRPCEALAHARSVVGRSAHQGLVLPEVLRDGVLAALVDADGFAAAAQHHRVPALPEPLRLFVPRPLDHGACFPFAIQPARSLRQTSGRLARREAGELREGRPRAATSTSPSRLAA